MVLALVLTYLEKIGEGFMSGIGGLLVAPTQEQFKYLCCFNSHITELETKLRDLEATRQVVQMGADEIRRQARDVRPDIEDWLKSVNDVTTEVKRIIQDTEKVEEGCLNGWCSNLKLRYSLSMQAVTKTKVLIDLRDVGVPYTQTLPAYRSPRPGLETITKRDFMRFESRRLNMEEVIKALKHDEIYLIGVCGMGGVGKTTMVNEVAKRAKEDNHFDEVAIAVVGQEPNLTNVQACIADMLGLKDLRDMESPIARADRLRKRLLQDNKKVLVILDDVWKEFDLQAMGIPLEGADKNFKVLYTSRTRDLWHDLQTKKEIPLKVLSKDEAWQLFREKAGDSADAPDLQPIAKQIVEECGCLPLALVLIGSALSKTSGKIYTKDIWKGMLDRLTCVGSTPADNDLSSRLALSYEYLEEEQAKRLFLLCCLFREDEDIRIEDLARYGLGLSLFDGIHEMEKVRRQVFRIVDELKSRCLLLDSEEEKEECVKVHDVVRDMGISIASKDKSALVIHEEVSEWPKDTYEHYSSISLISRKITELPKGLACPNLEFLLLDCEELKELPCQFFEGMGKLKVLVLKNFKGILALPSSLRNLHTLSLPFFKGKLEIVSEFGGLFNLNILSFRDSRMEELPEEIGELGKLRLLDFTVDALKRIPPSVISRLVHLEELYVLEELYFGGRFKDWEGECKEEEGRNANLRELALLSNLNTLEICIRSDVLIPKVRIFSNLKIYKVIIVQDDDKVLEETDEELEDERYNLFRKCERVFMVKSSIRIPLNRGGIDLLLRSSDCLVLEGKGCNDLVQALLPWDGVDGLQQLKLLKLLRITRCDTPECLANTMNPVPLPIAHAPAIFPILKVLDLLGLMNLREICGGPVPARSFGELTFIRVQNCGRLRNLFRLPIVGCLPQLKRLIISSCGMMEEVFWKDQQEDVHAAANRIEFPKLEVLKLEKLPSLVGFCRGIDQIDFPQLTDLYLKDIPKVNLLFHNNSNLSSNSKRNDNFGFLSLFPEKVSLPNLEFLHVDKLENLERLGHRPLSVGSFSKLNEIFLRDCGKLLCVIPSQFLPMMRELQELTVKSCHSLEVVFELEGLDSNEPNPEILSPLEFVELRDLPKLNCISKRDLLGIKYIQTLEIHDCKCLRYVFAPTMTKSIPELRKLEISRCEMLSRIVAEENGLGESSVDEVEFPQLEHLKLLDLPNLVSFFPNVNVNGNTTTLAKSTDHYHNPLQPQPLFNKKVAFPGLEYMELSGLQNVSDLWDSEFLTSSFSKMKNLQVTGCTSVSDRCISWFGDLNNTTLGLQEVAGLLYTNRGDGVLALGSNGTMTMLEVTTSVLPQLWERRWGNALPHTMCAMKNVIVVNLEEAVPCMALSMRDNHIIYACGGAISLVKVSRPFYASLTRDERPWKVLRTFMPPPPASTFLAFYPQDDDIIAIGMEDSTIRIYNYRVNEVKSELKGHEKRITGLAFSMNLNILVSSATDAQLCIWRIDTWEHLKSVSIQLPAGKVCNCDTRVQFHSDQIRLLVSHETQLAIYDASDMDCIRQWVSQDVLSAPISFAVYSSDSQLIYTSFCDGNIGVFDADSLTLTCRIAPSSYSPTLSSGGQAVYPRVVAAHPEKPNQFAIGLTNGFVVLMKPQESEGKWGLCPSTVDNGKLNDRTTSSSNTSNHTPDQNGDDPMARSMEKPKTLDDVTDKSKPWKVAETQCQLVVMPDSTDEAHKVARLVYTNGCEVLALGCNGALRLWRRYSSKNNQSGKATASVFPLQWQPAPSGLAMTNDVPGVNLEEAVPCMAFSKNYSKIISACGGAISAFDARTLKVMIKLKSPSSTTFLAFHPEDVHIIAFGMEDSTILIRRVHCDNPALLVLSQLKGHERCITSLEKVNRLVSSGVDAQVVSELKGHEKRITGLDFSTKLKRLVSSGADAQLCIWREYTWDLFKSVPIQLPTGKACNGDTRVQFHCDQIHLLVSHETQLAIYNASEMDCIRQWVPQDFLPAPISFAAYSCDSQLVYTSFCDGNIGVFDADSLTLTHRIAPSVYSPTLSSGSHAVYPLVVATHPWKPNQFAIGLTNGSVIIMEPQESEGKWRLSSNMSNHAPNQPCMYDMCDVQSTTSSSMKSSNVFKNQRKEEEELDVDKDEEGQEEKRKRKEKGKAPQSG